MKSLDKWRETEKCYLQKYTAYCRYKETNVMYIPHIPSLTLDEGIFKGLKPAFVQWYFPSEQADVPVK